MSRKALIDVAERTAATFVFGFLSVYSLSNLSNYHDALVAGGAAALTFAKSAIVNLISK